MRKPVTALAAATFALLIVAGGCAKEPPPAPPQSAKKAAAGTEKKSAPKPRAKLFAGTIEEWTRRRDADSEGPNGERGSRHAEGEGAARRTGNRDKVIVKHVDNVALSIVKPRTSKDYQKPVHTSV